MAGIRNRADFRYTIERQTTWGTPVDTAPIGLPCADLSITLEGDEHKIDVDRGIRVDHEDDTFIDTASMVPVARCSMPITSGMLKVLLPGLLQKTTDWTAAANVWDLFPTVPASIPLMRTSNQGYFYTLTKRSPTASLSERITNAVLRRLKLSLSAKENKGVLWGDLEFVGTTFSDTANPSGSITQDPLGSTVRYGWGDLASVLYDGGASILTDFVSFELDMTWNAELAGDTGRGEMLFPRFEANCTLVAGQNAVTQACKAYSRSQAVSTGRPLVLRWGDGTVSTAGEMDLTVFTQVKSFDDTDRSKGETHKIEFMAKQGGGATEYPVRFQYFAA